MPRLYVIVFDKNQIVKQAIKQIDIQFQDARHNSITHYPKLLHISKSFYMFLNNLLINVTK